MVGSGLDLGLWTVGDWAISEKAQMGLGLVGVPPAQSPNPQYHAYALFADHFGPTLLDVSATPAGVNAYASRDQAGDATDVIVVNWNRGHQPVSFSVEGLPTSPPAPSFDLPALSLVAVHVPDHGVATAWSYADAQFKAGTGLEPIAPWTGPLGGISAGHDGGSGEGGTTGAAAVCEVRKPTSPIIMTLGRVTGATVSFGAGSNGTWVSYTYAAKEQAPPSIAPTSDGNGLSISGGIITAADGGDNYVGAGVYYNSASCVDTSSFTGVSFDVVGDLGGCTLLVNVLISADLSTTADPTRGACQGSASSCFGPSVIVHPGPATLEVPFSAVTGGNPLYKVDGSGVVGVAWELLGATGLRDGGSCAANISIENAAFY